MTALEQLFLDVVNLSLTASWVIAVVLLLRFVFKPVPKKYGCLLWFVVLFRLLCAVTLESEFSLVPQHEEVKYENVYTTPQVETNSEPVNNVLNQTVNPALEQTSAPNPMGSVNPLQVYIFMAAWIWIIGIAVLCSYTLISWVRLRHQLAESIPDGGNVYVSDAITSPFVFGIVKPKIYLPYGLEDDEHRWVLLHEQSHIARRDYLVKPLFWIAVIVHWMNPLVWLAWFCFGRDLELACDERATASMNGNEKWNYSNTLLALAAEKRTFECPVAFSNNGVRQRIERILKYKQLPKVIIGVVIAMLMVCGVGLLFDNNYDTMLDYEQQFMEEDYTIDQIGIMWGSVSTMIKDEQEIARLKEKIDRLQVKATGLQSRNLAEWGGMVSFYDEMGNNLSNSFTFYPDCRTISQLLDLRVHNPEQLKNVLYPYCKEAMKEHPETTFYADLNRDGTPEIIIINRAIFAVYKQDGTILMSHGMTAVENESQNYFLCQQGNKDYLLYFSCAVTDNLCEYQWQLFDFDWRGEKRIKDEAQISFSLQPEQYRFDIDAIQKFIEDTNDVMDLARLLASVEKDRKVFWTVDELELRTAESYCSWWLEDTTAYRQLTAAEQNSLSLYDKLWLKQNELYYQNGKELLQWWLAKYYSFDDNKQVLVNPELVNIDGKTCVSFEWRWKSDDTPIGGQLIGKYAISPLHEGTKDSRTYYHYVDTAWKTIEQISQPIDMAQLADKWAKTYAERDGKERYNMLSRFWQDRVNQNEANEVDTSWLPFWGDNKESLSLGGSSPWVESWQTKTWVHTVGSVDRYMAEITYDMTDSSGETYIYAETIEFFAEDGVWKVTDCDIVIELMSTEIYQEIQKIVTALENGHETWRLNQQEVVLRFAQDYLGLAEGKIRAAGANRFYYEVDGQTPIRIHLYQPAINQQISGGDFWAVRAYEYPDMSQYGTDGTRFYDVRENAWASLHIRE